MFHFRFHRSESFLFEENIENIKSKRDFRERSPFVKGTKNENYSEAKALETTQCARKAEKYHISWTEYFEKITQI